MLTKLVSKTRTVFQSSLQRIKSHSSSSKNSRIIFIKQISLVSLNQITWIILLSFILSNNHDSQYSKFCDMTFPEISFQNFLEEFFFQKMIIEIGLRYCFVKYDDKYFIPLILKYSTTQHWLFLFVVDWACAM